MLEDYEQDEEKLKDLHKKRKTNNRHEIYWERKSLSKWKFCMNAFFINNYDFSSNLYHKLL